MIGGKYKPKQRWIVCDPKDHTNRGGAGSVEVRILHVSGYRSSKRKSENKDVENEFVAAESGCVAVARTGTCCTSDTSGRGTASASRPSGLALYASQR